MKETRSPKGMGNFTKNKNGTITYRKSVGYQDNGKRKVLCVTASSREAAIKKMREREKEWLEEQEDPGTTDTVAALCQKHLDYQVEMGDLKPKSRDRREVTISSHIEPYPLGRLQAQAVTVNDVEEHIKLLSRKELSASSIVKVVDVLNAAYKWARLQGRLVTNPIEIVKPTLVKRIQKRNEKTTSDVDVEFLIPAEQEVFVKEALRKTATGKYANEGALYILFLLYTGMRVGELLALTWEDVDLENGYVDIGKSRSMARNREEEGPRYIMIEGTTKNSKARKIKLFADALNVLKEIRELAGEVKPEQYICLTRTGRPNTTTNLENRNSRIMERAGLKYKGGLHILRRTFSTNQYRKGVRTKDIAAYIGDLASTTEKYYIAVRDKINIDGREEAVVILPEGSEK
ncbi:MAG: site-specific integrase [Lachnospiraceae bacterium]|nr:site-specific integrase [Lachnospiraceae bacterium]